MPEKKPPLEVSLVKEIVLTAHNDYRRVMELVEQEPALVNASWDWGGGDWETPLGSAAHMGRRDIAEYLLAHGARLDLFAAAMLGKVEIVKTALTAFPEMKDVPGPHGIPLLVHAQQGGSAAIAVVEYLTSLGG